jgi:large subunit ribosomal protein L21
MFAIIETGGKQYRVKQGDTLRVEKLNVNVGDQVEFKEVLAIGEGSNVTFGAPLLPNARVVAKAIEQGKAKKVIVFRYKAKSRYRKKNGHRQPFTKVVIEAIVAN